jgi:dsRNA-specific ribonuclease
MGISQESAWYDFGMGVEGISGRSDEELSQRFEKELDEFEVRADIALPRPVLRRVFTRVSFLARHLRPMPQELHQRRLELVGDTELRKLIETRLLEMDMSPYSRRSVRNYLNSNLIYSKAALDLGMNLPLRLDLTEAHGQGDLEKVLRLADTFESYAGAVHAELGEEELDAFLDRTVFSEKITRIALGLSAINEDKVRVAFKELAGDAATIKEETLTDGRPLIEISGEGCKTIRQVDRSLRGMIFAFLRTNPWIVWQFTGDASIHYPLARNTPFGKGISRSRNPDNA